jgi:hypothetical protein
MLICDWFDRDSCHAGPEKTENVGCASRDINDSALDERPPVIDHQHCGAVVGEIGHADMGSANAAFQSVQGCPMSSLILKDILAFLCETVQSWLTQANARY